MRQSMLPIVAGVIIGVAGSLASGRLLQQFLYQVKPGDPQVISDDRDPADRCRIARELAAGAPCRSD